MCIQVNAELIHAAGLVTAKAEKYRPALQNVVVCKRGDEVEVWATDSYVMFRCYQPVSGEQAKLPDEEIRVSYPSVKAAIPKRGVVTLCANHDTDDVSVTTATGSVSVRTLQKTGPYTGNINKMVDDARSGSKRDVHELGLNPDYVQTLWRAMKTAAQAGGSKPTGVRLVPNDDLLPIYLAPVYERRPKNESVRMDCILMPVKL